MTKINLRIISKPHAQLQTMTKTPVKFQNDRHKTVHKTVGGVVHTTYLLLEGAEPRKAEYYVPLLFFEKAGDKNTIKFSNAGFT